MKKIIYLFTFSSFMFISNLWAGISCSKMINLVQFKVEKMRSSFVKTTYLKKETELMNRIFNNEQVDILPKIKLKELLNLDDLNFTYYLSLLDQYLNPQTSEKIWIQENGLSKEGKTIAYPTAIADTDMMKEVPVTYYENIISDPNNAKSAKKVVLWLKKMQAGTGSSMQRSKFLTKLGKDASTIGAKGTDLFINLKGHDEAISLVEILTLQAIYSFNRGDIAGIAFHDIVGPETSISIAKIWNKPSFIDPNKTYGELIAEIDGLSNDTKTFQSKLPTLYKENYLSNARVAPGGHGLFAVDAFLDALNPKKLPKITSSQKLISVIANGEDLSGTPDPAMLGYMAKNEIPIIMVTTTKTPNDMKGGQIAVVVKPDGTKYVTIIEKAQAEQTNQLELFEKMGISIKKGDQISFFNTNMALFNYDILVPKLSKLLEDVGIDRFMQIISPTLIVNNKTQVDIDGKERQYTQLEGAMGSSILKLDKYWREHYGEPLVHFINVEAKNRTKFFSPIKTAWDFYMQFFSDRFSLDTETMLLTNNRPESLPSVSLKDSYYKEVQHVLDAFKNANILNLDKLTIKGKVSLKGFTLEGKVEIDNKTGELIDLKAYFPQTKMLKDKKIVINNKDHISISSI